MPSSKTNSESSAKCKPLRSRKLLSSEQAEELAKLFKVLASDTRLRILHALIRAGELCVTDLANAVAMKPQAVSNQIQKLAELGILTSRRDGNSIYYKVTNCCVQTLLDQAICLSAPLSLRR